MRHFAQVKTYLKALKPIRSFARAIESKESFQDWPESISFAFFRVTVGGVVVFHGLTQLMNSHGSIAGATLGLTGIDLSPEASRLVVFLELGGGAGVAVGFFTRAFAAAITVEAVWSTILLWSTDPRLSLDTEYPLWSFPFLLGASMFSVFLCGGGRWSLDRWLEDDSV